ncbi:hypothetical protein HCA49_08020 [Listeria booriae]|nr:hypothetical protein [Listeria booriae]
MRNVSVAEPLGTCRLNPDGTPTRKLVGILRLYLSFFEQPQQCERLSPIYLGYVPDSLLSLSIVYRVSYYFSKNNIIEAR